MIIFYHKDEFGNFGDDLNIWLWHKLLPRLDEVENDTLFVGIGTLLNHKLPKEKNKVIFGSGFGYGNVPVVDSKWNIYALRGYDTALKLGISDEYVITDPAILLRTVDLFIPEKKHKIGFIPHSTSSWLGDWDGICKNLNIHYINVAWSVDRVLEEIQQCELIITEAMHGAIVADALRVPWSPIIMYDFILSSKWADWLSTLDIEYQPQHINPIWHVARNLNAKTIVKDNIKRTLMKIGFEGKNWTPPYHAKSGSADYAKTMADIEKVIKNNQFYLSKDEIIERHLDKYDRQLNKFKRDFSL